MLYLRKFTVISELDEIVYNVYEAKRVGEITPGVGTTTTLNIVHVCGDRLRGEFVGPKGFVFLEKQLKMFGPKRFRPSKLPRGFISYGYGEWGSADDEITPEAQPDPEATTAVPSHQPPSQE